MNDHTYWQWVLMGMGGVVNMVEGLTREGIPITKAQHEILTRYVESLMEVPEKMSTKIKDG